MYIEAAEETENENLCTARVKQLGIGVTSEFAKALRPISYSFQ